MAMKNKKTRNKGRRLSSILRDNKGIETRVLIYVIAAVVLIAVMVIAINVAQTGETLADIGLAKSAKTMKDYLGDDPGIDTTRLDKIIDKAKSSETSE